VLSLHHDISTITGEEIIVSPSSSLPKCATGQARRPTGAPAASLSRFTARHLRWLRKIFKSGSRDLNSPVAGIASTIIASPLAFQTMQSKSQAISYPSAARLPAAQPDSAATPAVNYNACTISIPSRLFSLAALRAGPACSECSALLFRWPSAPIRARNPKIQPNRCADAKADELISQITVQQPVQQLSLKDRNICCFIFHF